MSRVNVKQTETMISSENAGRVAEEAKIPCTISKRGVFNNFIFCQFSTCEMHGYLALLEANWKRFQSLNIMHF